MTRRDVHRLLAFDHWANTQVLDAVELMAAQVPRAVDWLAHVAAAKRIWFARVTDTAMPVAVNPTMTPAEIRVQLQVAHDEWSGYLSGLTDADLPRVMHYTNLKGAPFHSTLEDILTHLAIHGQQHRGQANAAIREAGGAPPVIDYIHASRSGAV